MVFKMEARGIRIHIMRGIFENVESLKEVRGLESLEELRSLNHFIYL